MKNKLCLHKNRNENTFLKKRNFQSLIKNWRVYFFSPVFFISVYYEMNEYYHEWTDSSNLETEKVMNARAKQSSCFYLCWTLWWSGNVTMCHKLVLKCWICFLSVNMGLVWGFLTSAQRQFVTNPHQRNPNQPPFFKKKQSHVVCMSWICFTSADLCVLVPMEAIWTGVREIRMRERDAESVALPSSLKETSKKLVAKKEHTWAKLWCPSLDDT